MLAAYKMRVGGWQAFTKKGTVPNFLVHQAHKVLGQDQHLDEVLPGAAYPIAPSATGFYPHSVRKYGRRFDILWEAIVNDAMGAFSDIAARFANAVIRTQARHVAGVLAVAAGPNPALFGAPIADPADGQAVVNLGVLPLTIVNLQITCGLMRAQTDPNGELIYVEPRYLVVPQTLAYTAREILKSVQYQQAAAALPVPTYNALQDDNLELVVLPELQQNDLSATSDTTWYLVGEYGEACAVQFDQLAGNQGPDIRIKSSGSGASPLEGDFDTDSIAYRVRDVHGAAPMDPRYAYAQVGP
jgi:hypothetical protein